MRGLCFRLSRSNLRRRVGLWPTKLLVAREKKPPVPRVCNGISFLRIVGAGGGENKRQERRGGVR